MENKYQNPYNTEEILEELKSCSTLGTIKDLINQVFPEWIKNFSRGYSADYPSLTESWHTFCQALLTAPKGIILVEFIPPSIKDDTNGTYSLLRKFLDVMTTNGFVVRRRLEFKDCTTCKLILPTHGLYQKIKFLKPNSVPENWDYTCSNCKPYADETYEDGNPKLHYVPKNERSKFTSS